MLTMGRRDILNGLAVAVLVLGLLNVFLARLAAESYPGFATAFNYAAVVLILGAFIVVNRLGVPRSRLGYATPLVFFLIAALVISVRQFASSGDPDGFKRVASFAGYFMLAYLVLNKACVTDDGAARVLRRFTWILAAVVCVQFAFVKSPWAYYLPSALVKERFMGITANPNTLGYLAGLALVMAFMVYRSTGHGRGRVYAVMMVPSAAMMLYTNSKASILASAVFFAVYLLRPGRAALLALMFAPSAVLFTLIGVKRLDLVLGVIDRVNHAYPRLAGVMRLDAISIGGRMEMFLNVIFNHLFYGSDWAEIIYGHGLRTWPEGIMLDNLFLFVFYEQGALGAAALGAVLAYPVFSMGRASTPLNRGFVALAVSLAFHANFETTLFAGLTLLTVVFLLCYTCILNHGRSAPEAA
jgi:hypothetical protein